MPVLNPGCVKEISNRYRHLGNKPFSLFRFPVNFYFMWISFVNRVQVKFHFLFVNLFSGRGEHVCLC